jgi:hypothetical protein
VRSSARYSASSSSASGSTITSLAVRLTAALILPLGLVVAASVVTTPGVSTGLLCAAFVSLLVWVSESVVDLRKRPVHDVDRSWPDDAVGQTQTSRIIDLFVFVGDTTRLLVELSDAGAPAVDGWLGLVSGRVARVIGSAAAGAMVLRETLLFEGEDFLPGCEVRHRGGAKMCSLPVGQKIPTHDRIEADLEGAIGAGSVYVAEFNLSQDRYLLCLVTSSSHREPYLDTLCKVMVAPVLASLKPRDESLHGPEKPSPFARFGVPEN